MSQYKLILFKDTVIVKLTTISFKWKFNGRWRVVVFKKRSETLRIMLETKLVFQALETKINLEKSGNIPKRCFQII